MEAHPSTLNILVLASEVVVDVLHLSMGRCHPRLLRLPVPRFQKSEVGTKGGVFPLQSTVIVSLYPKPTAEAFQPWQIHSWRLLIHSELLHLRATQELFRPRNLGIELRL